MEKNFSSTSLYLCAVVCFAALFPISSTEAFCEGKESVPVTGADDCAACKSTCVRVCEKKGSAYSTEQCITTTGGFSCDCCCSAEPFSPPPLPLTSPPPPSTPPPPPVICNATSVEVYGVHDCFVCTEACGVVCKETSLIRDQCAPKTNPTEKSCQCCCVSPPSPPPAPPSPPPPPPIICKTDPVEVFGAANCVICEEACGQVCKETSLIRDRCAPQTNPTGFSCQCCCASPPPSPSPPSQPPTPTPKPPSSPPLAPKSNPPPSNPPPPQSIPPPSQPPTVSPSPPAPSPSPPSKQPPPPRPVGDLCDLKTENSFSRFETSCAACTKADCISKCTGIRETSSFDFCDASTLLCSCCCTKSSLSSSTRGHGSLLFTAA